MEKDDKSWPRATWDQLAGKSIDTSLRLLVRDHRQLVSRMLSSDRALHDAYVRIDDLVAEVERSPVAVGRIEMAQ